MTNTIANISSNNLSKLSLADEFDCNLHEAAEKGNFDLVKVSYNFQFELGDKLFKYYLNLLLFFVTIFIF
jgi:hypothetical protein